MENFAEAKISLRGESGEERKFFNESFREVRELIKKIYSTRSNRELDLIDPTWSPTFIAIHLFPLSLSSFRCTLAEINIKMLTLSSLVHQWCIPSDFERDSSKIQGSRLFFKNNGLRAPSNSPPRHEILFSKRKRRKNDQNYQNFTEASAPFWSPKQYYSRSGPRAEGSES